MKKRLVLPIRHYALTALVMLMLLMPLSALADDLVVDGDGLVPVSGNALNLGTIPCNQSASGNALLAISRNGQGNVYANDADVTISAGVPSNGNVSTSFSDQLIELPGNWTGATNNTMSSDTATSRVTVNAVAPAGAKSATVVYSATGTKNTGGTLVRTATLTINWTVGPCDTTPPVITPNVSGTQGNNGWYTSDVTVSWSVTDPESTISNQSGCGSATVSTDTAGQTFTCAATSAGGTNSKSVTIERDATAPSAAASASPAANGNGWNNGPVTVSFSGTDIGGSGIASCSAPQPLSGDGAGQTATGSCTDNAGNSASATATISIDIVAPSVSASAAPAANGNGWNNGNVTVSFTGSDALSGIDSCDAATVLNSDGAGQTASGSCTDKAGNSASAAASNINIDTVAPSVSASAAPAANGSGWNNSPVTVSFTGSDALSGIDSCDAATVLSSEGASQSASGSCTDNAGNSASATVSGINIDTVAPVTSASASPAANGSGWNNSNVTVSFTGSDSGSGIDSCSADEILSSEGENQSASGSCTDLAGNTSASATASGIRIDKTKPSVSASASPAPNSNGWNNGPVTVSFSGTDIGGSGIASCSADEILSSEGASQSASGSCTDNAGNSASATASGINIDTVAPVASASASPAANGSGWNNSNVTVSFSGTDIGGSGIDSCSADKILSSEGENQSATGSCTDNAGNSSSDTASGINIDKTKPSVSASASPAANGSGWNNGPVTVSFTGTDIGGSGIASCSADEILSSEGSSQSASGSCTDNAGNSASATASGINIDTVAPVTSASASPAPNSNGWNNGPVTVSFTGTDIGGSGIDSCDAAETLSSEAANQSATGSCTDNAGNSSSDTASGINIDKTKPVASVTGVAQSATYTLGSVPTAGCSSTDNLSGVDTQAILSTIGGPVGSITATCSGATDKAGNAGPNASATYSINYVWSGFLRPVDNLPTLNSAKAGSAIPVKFNLNGNQGMNIFMAGSPSSAPIACDSSAMVDAIDETVTAGSSSLSFDPATNQYNYVWKTDKSWNGCRQLVVKLVDGTTYRANFKFTK